MDNQPNQALMTVKERYDHAPYRIIALFTSGRYERTLQELSDRYNLTEKQTKLLDNELFLVLLVFLPQTGLASRLAESLEIDTETAQRIAYDANNQIFVPVNDILVEAEKELFADIKKESVTTPPAPVSANTGTKNTLQPLRTMEGDLKRIHGYGSFGDLYGSEENGEAVYKSDQDQVIKKQNLANTPTYNDSENPQ